MQYFSIALMAAQLVKAIWYLPIAAFPKSLICSMCRTYFKIKRFGFTCLYHFLRQRIPYMYWRLCDNTNPQIPFKSLPSHLEPAPSGHNFIPIPFFDTNWEVTPISNVEKTGEWSLVMMSSVQPAESKSKWIKSKGSSPDWRRKQNPHLICSSIQSRN